MKGMTSPRTDVTEGLRAKAPDLQVRRGTCYAVYAFDIASSIDLDVAQARVEPTERQTVQQKRRAPEYFEYRPAPLRVNRSAPSLPVGRFTTAPNVELVMYDFGAVSLSFAIPISGAFGDLLDLATQLRENAVLRSESRRHVEQLVELIGPAAERARIASFVEDYAMFELVEWEPSLDAEGLRQRLAPAMAQILRAESRLLSSQETDQATALRGSFGPGDLTVIDTDAALIFDPDAADVRAVIEFANAQILEMRVLDQQLDEMLERSYDLLARNRVRGIFLRRDTDTRMVAQFQVESAILFERVTNALKLIGEQYLTRIYGLVSRRFHLAEWDAAISRKLATIESIYEKMSEQATTRRMEVLEWIIIILIAFSILLPFFSGAGAK
jgi:hypothetical protein